MSGQGQAGNAAEQRLQAMAARAVQLMLQPEAQEGTALAIAARDMDEESLREAGHRLGGAISEALLEVFDGLLGQDDQG